ncbi:hypothetical protein Tco_0820325 [Tanacetum coccineum]|uniref:Uncharacterized protein n=1 Tax=Tanacetum coccineum TaxID=301880 RepID=A0ABQ5A9Z2_9ASTR
MHILNDPSFFLTNKTGAPQANRYDARATGVALGIKLIWNSTGRAGGRPDKSSGNTYFCENLDDWKRSFICFPSVCPPLSWRISVPRRPDIPSPSLGYIMPLGYPRAKLCGFLSNGGFSLRELGQSLLGWYSVVMLFGLVVVCTGYLSFTGRSDHDLSRSQRHKQELSSAAPRILTNSACHVIISRLLISDDSESHLPSSLGTPTITEAVSGVPGGGSLKHTSPVYHAHGAQQALSSSGTLPDLRILELRLRIVCTTSQQGGGMYKDGGVVVNGENMRGGASASPAEGRDSEIGGDGDGVVHVKKSSQTTSASSERDRKVWCSGGNPSPIEMFDEGK